MTTRLPEETPVPLPAARTFTVSRNVVAQPPLSRRGDGPGVVLVVGDGMPLGHGDQTLDPPPLLKWAEEGYAVVQIILHADGDAFGSDLDRAIRVLTSLESCSQKDKYGLIAYVPLPRWYNPIFNIHPTIAAIINYSTSPFPPQSAPIPILWHLASPTPPSVLSLTTTTHLYPTASPNFILPAHPHHHPTHASTAHTRSLTFLKPLVGGPFFDLAAIWDEHTRFEFADRAVARTMGTMVQEPYVNHVPTLTGGVGRERLTQFYRNHFIHSNPPDTALVVVSRTVGVDRVVEEFVFSCTHDRVVDWLVPGVPPTGKKLEVPFTAVVNIRGDRLFHEHISWDQATLLRQLGLLPEWLPFPYEVEGRRPKEGKRFEYRVPVAGVETARKLVDENAVESNGMFGFGVREVDDV